MRANSLRGECAILVAGEEVLIRPTFNALVAAEAELGSLIGLIERAGEAKLLLSEIAALFHHLSVGRNGAIDREIIGETLLAMGMSNVTPLLRIIFAQILEGSAS